MGTSGESVAKHDPFVYFANIITSSVDCGSANTPGLVVPAGAGSISCPQSASDIPSTAANALVNDFNFQPPNPSPPNLAFLVPNLLDDSHDCSVSSADYYLNVVLPKLFNTYTFQHRRAAVVVTFDEPKGTDNAQTTPLYFAMAGPMARSGSYTYSTSLSLNHYSLLKAIEDNFGLTEIGNSATSSSGIASMFYPAGDVDADCADTIGDLASIAIVFGATSTQTNFNPMADLDGNGAINIVDLAISAINFNVTC